MNRQDVRKLMVGVVIACVSCYLLQVIVFLNATIMLPEMQVSAPGSTTEAFKEGGFNELSVIFNPRTGLDFKLDGEDGFSFEGSSETFINLTMLASNYSDYIPEQLQWIADVVNNSFGKAVFELVVKVLFIQPFGLQVVISG